jgi:hypothetical protein
VAEYAKNTEVSSDRSRQEIERTLVRYGATGFMYGWNETPDGPISVVAFQMHGRRIQFRVPMPLRSEFVRTETGRPRTKASADAAWEQAGRQRWRALLLVIKAKLEAVDAGITDFEAEFLSAMVLPGGRTVGEEIMPRIDAAYQTGVIPDLLPGLPSPVQLLLAESEQA